MADVRGYLEPLGISVQELPSDTSTAPLAARALGTPVDAIVKSLLFLLDGQAHLVLASGSRKVDQRVLAREQGADKARLAKPDEVLALTGYAVGGVPPVGHRRSLPTLIDVHLLELETVYAAAGAGNAVFAIAPAHLVELTGATLTEAAR